MTTLYRIFFTKGRKSTPVLSPGTFADRGTAIDRATQHLDLLAGIGVKGATAIVTTDETLTSVDEANNAYQIRRYGEAISEVSIDDADDNEGVE